MPTTLMPRRPINRRSRLAVASAAILLAAGALAGCGGGDDGGGGDGPTAAERLESARTTLAEAKGVTLTLATDEVPKGKNGILKAEGVGTDAPAFKGEISAVLGGLSADVPVVAVDGKVYASLFGGKYAEIDPSEYSVPDPASLFGADGGLVKILTDVGDLETGDQVRDGKAVLSTLTGTIDGKAVQGIFPSADDGSFDATFTLDDDDRLVKAEVTGPFYGGEGDSTYTIGFSKYGTVEDIKKP